MRNGLGLGVSQSTSRGDGTALSMTFAGAGSLDPRVTFTRASSATYYNSAGVLSTALTNAPRLDYNPATLAARGLLVEEARTNLITASNSGATPNPWVTAIGDEILTANAAVSPDGTMNAHQIVSLAASGFYYDNVTVLNATVYTATIHAKAVSSTCSIVFGCNAAPTTGTAVFNLSAGTLTSQAAGVTAADITSVGNGWYRCRVTYTSTGTTNLFINYSSVSAETWLYYGFQLEAGAFATSYIPTTAGTVTRALDVATLTGTNFSSWFNATTGTFLSNFDVLSIGAGTRPVLSADDNTANESLRLYGSTADPKVTITDGGVDVADLDLGTLVANTLFKAGFVYVANDAAASGNGGAAQTDASVTLPTVDRLRIGANQAGNTLNGHVAMIKYYRTRLTNGQLIALTT